MNENIFLKISQTINKLLSIIFCSTSFRENAISSTYIKTAFRNIKRTRFLVISLSSKIELGINSRVIKSELKIEGINNKILLENDSTLSQTTVIIKGDNNTVKIGRSCCLRGAKLEIQGSHNQLCLGNNIYIGEEKTIENSGEYYLLGHYCNIIIGDRTSIRNATVVAAEVQSSITIGEDCMFADSIRISTSDGHPIFHLNDFQKVNSPKDVFIGDHVWICSHVAILKGSKIGKGCILGTGSIVTKSTPTVENSTIYGSPAKLGETGVTWGRLSFYDENAFSKIDIPDALSYSYYCKGLTQVQLRSEGLAISSFLRALELKPDFAPAHYDLGKIFEKDGQTEKALERYMLATVHRADYIEALVAQARLLVNLGRREEAIAIIKKISKIQPHNEEIKEIKKQHNWQ